MVLLPLIYVALIVLVIVALGYHAVNHVTIFQHAKGSSGVKGAVLIYVTPLVCGAVMVAFMLKPLFAKSAQPMKGRTLDPQAEPLLYAFIDGVCTSVGAPRPKRIEVDSRINAAAGYSGGPFSLFGREPYLVIGLGLVAGLDLKQLAGVMAHELGHISQRSGMWLSEVIGSINHWFARVVYERDTWDQALEEWSANDNNYIKIMGGLARLAVWLTRRVLWVLMNAGHLVNMVVSRQQEFDADRYAARMVGAKTFAETSSRLNELSLASQGAMSDLQSSWQQRRLPDDYPKLILANVPQVPAEMLAAYRKSVDETRTGFFDTHPSDRDRIAHAQVEEPGNGIFNLDGPATDVFGDFDALARSVTLDYYRSMLGLEIGAEQLYPVAELVESQSAAQEGHLAFDRFFLKALSMTQRLVLPGDYPTDPADLECAKRELVAARNDQQAARAECLDADKRDSAIFARLVKAQTAWIMVKSDVPFDAEDWGVSAATIEAAEAARDLALAELPEVTAQLEPYAVAVARRLTLSLASLESEAVADQVADSRERREEAHTLYPCAAHLGGNIVSQLDPTLRATKVLNVFIEMWNEAKDKQSEVKEVFRNALFRAAGELHTVIEALRSTVGDTVQYPFEHVEEDITVARFAFPAELPAADDIGALLEVADAAIKHLLGLHKRALGRLAVTAEEVERALGLEPIASGE
jgi:Zn-dependent protease with chaperone function